MAALSYRDARFLQRHSDWERRKVVGECAGGLQSGRAARVRRRRTAAVAGSFTSPGRALAQRTIGPAVFTCGGCGAWLFRANDMVDDASRECDVTLTDSTATVCKSTSSTVDCFPRAARRLTNRGVVCVQVPGKPTSPYHWTSRSTSATARRHGSSRRPTSRAQIVGCT
jgi:hypothetical protein